MVKWQPLVPREIHTVPEEVLRRHRLSFGSAILNGVFHLFSYIANPDKHMDVQSVHGEVMANRTQTVTVREQLPWWMFSLSKRDPQRVINPLYQTGYRESYTALVSFPLTEYLLNEPSVVSLNVSGNLPGTLELLATRFCSGCTPPIPANVLTYSIAYVLSTKSARRATIRSSLPRPLTDPLPKNQSVGPQVSA